MGSVSDFLKARGIKLQSASKPLWKGPEEDGITYSLLSRFLVCRERFRLHVIEGLVPMEGFNNRIEYGNMWHLCEEAWAANNSKSSTKISEVNMPRPWEQPLKAYAQELCRKYPTQQEQVEKYYRACRVQFPVYLQWWSRHPDTATRKNIFSEEKFNIPYKLPSKRIVHLRGKWDSVDIIGKPPNQGLYIQENKTKGDIVEQQLRRQLNFDLQTMIYAVAFTAWQSLDDYGEPVRFPEAVNNKLKGVRYNVIRRPFSGGKGNIRPHQATSKKPAETQNEYFARLEEIFRSHYGAEVDLQPDQHYFFMRWQVEISDRDIRSFREQCLDPLLEQLCDWWEHIQNCLHAQVSPFHQSSSSVDPRGIHWRHPFGVFNILDEGGSSELDEYLSTGSRAGLFKSTDLFPELR